MKNIIITGCAGFIGSHVVRLFVSKYPEYHPVSAPSNHDLLGEYECKRFYHISTDEVYGALLMTLPESIKPPFTTKASSDHFVRAIDLIFHEGKVAETYNI